MIASNGQWIFLHWPKTGGNSVQDVLSQFSGDAIVPKVEPGQPLDRFEVINKNFPLLHKHSSLDDYRRAVGFRTLRSAWVFVTIRNPWDRLVSHYFSPHRGTVKWEKSKFEGFVRRQASLADFLALKPLGRKLSFSGEKLVNSFLRFEKLQNDFSRVLRILNLPETELPRRNFGPARGGDYRQFYSEEIAQFVAKRHQFEAVLGNYKFEPVSS